MDRKNAIILLVAQNSRSVATLSEALSGNNHLINCESLSEAETYLKTNKIDLMIASVDNSSSDASERIRAMRSIQPDLPLILITDSEHTAIKPDAPVDGVITGPFRISRIEEMIKGIFSDRAKDKALPAGKSLLVVDDDEVFRSVLIRTLKLSGYSVMGAADGKMALEIIKKGGIDTVITDVNMPHMDGLSLLNNIKKDHPGIPVILITGYLSANQADQDSQYEPDGFLMKPFNVRGIINLLEDIKK